MVTPFVRGPGEEGGGTGSFRPPVSLSVAGRGAGVGWGGRLGEEGEREARRWGRGRGEPGGVGAGALLTTGGARRPVTGGTWGKVRAGEALGGEVGSLVGEGGPGEGLLCRDGKEGLGEAEGEWRPLTGGFTGEM